jgi:hypothetical protein
MSKSVNPDSIALRFGPYSMPEGVRLGDQIECLFRRREVLVKAISDAPIQWPLCRRGRKRFVILCGDLVRAVRMEATIAVAHHWGVGPDTVSLWRRALKVDRLTPGTALIYREQFHLHISPEDGDKGRAMAQSAASRQKRSAAKIGKPVHKNTLKALLKAAKRPKSQAHREAMSRSHKAIGRRPPGPYPDWLAEEIARLGTAPDAIISAELGRSVEAVYVKRRSLKIPKYQQPTSK